MAGFGTTAASQGTNDPARALAWWIASLPRMKEQSVDWSMAIVPNVAVITVLLVLYVLGRLSFK